MFVKIKNISINNANLLSCPYTNGLSLTAFKGFVDSISFKLNQVVSGFSIVLNQIDTKYKENIVRDSMFADIENYNKNKNYFSVNTNPSILQDRYFNFNFDLILKIDEEFNPELLFSSINALKVQGGIIAKEVYYNIEENNIISDNVYSLLMGCNPISYLITDASHEISDDRDIIEQFADKLSIKHSDYFLISNGYMMLEHSDYKRHIELSDREVNSKFVEPNLSIAKALYIYQIKKDQTLLKNFLFQTFNKENSFLIQPIL